MEHASAARAYRIVTDPVLANREQCVATMDLLSVQPAIRAAAPQLGERRRRVDIDEDRRVLDRDQPDVIGVAIDQRPRADIAAEFSDFSEVATRPQHRVAGRLAS